MDGNNLLGIGGPVAMQIQVDDLEEDAVVENNHQGIGGPVAMHLAKFGCVRGLVFGSYGEWSEDVEDLVRMCTREIAKLHWMEAGFNSQMEANALYTNYTFKKLTILSLKSVADLMSNRMSDIGSDDGGKGKAHTKGWRKDMEASRMEQAGIHTDIRNNSSR